MVNSLGSTENDLDNEWAELILYALEVGMSIEDIRDFFNKYSRPE